MKILIYLRNFLFALTTVIIITNTAAAESDSANDKLTQIERDTYGLEQPGAILSRLNRIEKDYTGENLRGNMNVRIDALYDVLYANNGGPSVLAKVNALEWNVNHEVIREGIGTRISQLESTILGAISRDTFNNRIRELAIASFGSDDIPLIEMQLPARTLIKAGLLDAVDSRNLKVGDTVAFKVAEDVIVDGKLVFAKGLRGEGTVTKVVKAKGLTGRNGKVEINFDTLSCIDGRNIHVYVGDASKQAMRDAEMIEGAQLVGLDLSSKWNKVMVHGKNVDISANTEFYVETQSAAIIYGLQNSAGFLYVDEGLTADEMIGVGGAIR